MNHFLGLLGIWFFGGGGCGFFVLFCCCCSGVFLVGFFLGFFVCLVGFVLFFFSIVVGIERKRLKFSRISYFWMPCWKHQSPIYLKEHSVFLWHIISPMSHSPGSTQSRGCTIIPKWEVKTSNEAVRNTYFWVKQEEQILGMGKSIPKAQACQNYEPWNFWTEIVS